MKMPARILVAVAAMLPVAPGSSKDAVKPSAQEQIDASAQKIKELQKKRITTLKVEVEIFTIICQNRLSYFDEALEAWQQLLQAELGTAEKGADRISLYKEAINALEKYEEWANGRVQAGRESSMTVLKIKARRLELKIQLEQAKAKEAKPGMTSPQIKDLQKEQIDIIKKLVDGLTRVDKNSRTRLKDTMEARRLLLQAKLNAAEKGADRISLYKEAIDSLKKYEEWANNLARQLKLVARYIDSLKKYEEWANVAVLKIKARRLGVNIQLEQAKAKEAKEAAVADIRSEDQVTASAKKIMVIQKERIAVLKEMKEQLTILFQHADVHYEEVLEAMRLQIEAELEAAETDTERGELFKKLVVVLKQCELDAIAKKAAGQGTEGRVLKERARLLEAEIRSEHVKMKVAKQGMTQSRLPDTHRRARPSEGDGL